MAAAVEILDDVQANEPAPEGQHIFHAAKLEPMAKKWQELNTDGLAGDVNASVAAMKLLEQIIVMSTPMFERLAMHEEFHLTVSLSQLISAAQEKVVIWLIRWDPEKGRLFSWFSKCAKNAFRAEITKEIGFRNKVHTTDESLEKWIGSEDHEVDKHDSANEVRQRLRQITCRWGHPQEIGTIHFLLECVIEDNHSKELAIQGASFAWGLAIDHVRFFYTWCLIMLRNAMRDKISIPMTEQDLICCKYSYTYLPDFLTIIPWERRCPHCKSGGLKDLIAMFHGMRIKFPTAEEIVRLKKDYKIHEEIGRSDLDPDSVSTIVKKHKRPAKSAEQLFRDMAQLHDPKISGEYYIYDENDDAYTNQQ